MSDDDPSGSWPGPAATPHELLNPSSLPRPAGYSHVVVPAAGRTIYLAGQAGHRADGTLPGGDLVAQLDQALANVVEALGAAGARPEHLVSVQLYVRNAAEYRERRAEIGEAWRRHLGRHYPAAALFEVSDLFDPRAKIELVCVAVVPS